MLILYEKTKTGRQENERSRTNAELSTEEKPLPLKKPTLSKKSVSKGKKNHFRNLIKIQLQTEKLARDLLDVMYGGVVT